MDAFNKKQRLRLVARIVFVAVAVAASTYAVRSWARADQPLQPIAFNHRAHVTGAQIECSECHAYFSTTARSGLPKVDVCMTCHSEPVTKSPEEARLRQRVESGEPVVFRKLFHLPAHVYYSHRRHVVLGKLECKQCHGEIANTEAPPSAPLVKISMDFCTGCHARSRVTNECKSCHR